MDSSRRDLLIDTFVDGFISKSNKNTLAPCFTFMELPKTGASFCCEGMEASVSKRRGA